MSQVKSSTLRQLLVQAEEAFHSQDAFRYKVKGSNDEGKKTVKIEAKTYGELRKDSEKLSAHHSQMIHHQEPLGIQADASDLRLPDTVIRFDPPIP